MHTRVLLPGRDNDIHRLHKAVVVPVSIYMYLLRVLKDNIEHL